MFGELPKTSTGKIQKFVLRERASSRRQRDRVRDRADRRPTPHDERRTRSTEAASLVLRTERRAWIATLTLNRGERYNALSRAMLAALAGASSTRVAARPRRPRRRPRGERARASAPGTTSKEMLRASATTPWQRELFDGCSRMMIDADAAAAAGDRARARHRDRGRLPAGVDVRPGGRRRHGALRAARRQRRRVLLDARGRRRRNVARKRVMEMLLTGDTIDAATALDWGLVNRVVPRRGPRRRGQRSSRIGSSPAAPRSSRWASAPSMRRSTVRSPPRTRARPRRWHATSGPGRVRGDGRFLEKRAAKWRSAVLGAISDSDCQAGRPSG